MIKGELCIEAAKKAHDIVSNGGDPEEAQKHLSALQNDVKYMLKVAEESKEDCGKNEIKLRQELERNVQEEKEYEAKIVDMKAKKSREEARRRTQVQHISDTENDLREAERRLSNAESDLRSAKEKEKVTMVTAVGVGTVVGLLTFGVGGLVVGAAVGVGAGALINEAEHRVRSAKNYVSNRKDDISRKNQELDSINRSLNEVNINIRKYEGVISRNAARVREIQREIGAIKKSTKLCLEAVHFWDLFSNASDNAMGITERLGKIMKKVTQTRNLKIMRANGTVTKAKSLLEAWNEVQKIGGKVLAITE